MITIDGSQSEGGRQILRPSLALALVTGRAVPDRAHSRRAGKRTCVVRNRRARLDFFRLQMQNAGMPDEYSRRMDKLESHLAHLEYQVEQLNEVVIEQGNLLERLKKEVQRQSHTMQTLELERMKSSNQKPPHYQ